MKKRKTALNKKNQRQKPKNTSSRLSTKGFSASRRVILKSSIGVGIAIAGGVWLHHHDASKKLQHNLDAIGAGKPVVLQVHDPSCPSCRQLMRSTKTALKSLPNIEYRIADLTTSQGAAIGDKYNVGKVTLLLFDSRGKHVNTVQGITPANELRDLFAAEFETGEASS